MKPVLPEDTKAVVDGTIIVEIVRYNPEADTYLVDTGGFGEMEIAEDHVVELA